MIVANNASAIDSFYHRNNSWYNNGNSNNPLWVSGTPLHSFAGNNTTTNPKLDATFKPMAGSPVIDAGLLNGLSYIGLAPDKGFAEYQSALPIFLVEFSASGNNASNLLQWKTSSEVNSSHFIIQRSSNGTDFENVGSTAAAGSSSTLTPYSFTDYTPHSFINYYRLLMVDKDNSKEYSGIVFVKSGDGNNFKIVSANLSLSARTVTVTASSTRDQKTLMQVVDNNGKVLLNEAVTLQKGINVFTKNIQQAAQGIYYVRLQSRNEAAVNNILSSN